jgi:hypothetical protein
MNRTARILTASAIVTGSLLALTACGASTGTTVAGCTAAIVAESAHPTTHPAGWTYPQCAGLSTAQVQQATAAALPTVLKNAFATASN